jgi:hypothetical protein
VGFAHSCCATVPHVSSRSRPALAAIAVYVVAPLLSVVLIAALLLVGVRPHWVFLPGHTLKAGFGALGLTVPNAVGVVGTVITWWALILFVWLVLRRFTRTG